MRFLYLAGFLDEAIVAERGLPSLNAAGSNRVSRLSGALRRVGARPIVVSPATSMRAYSAGGPFINNGRVKRESGFVVIYPPSINIPIIGDLCAVFFLISTLIRVMRHPVQGCMVYNFSPAFAMATLWLRFVYRLKIISNIEDVSVSRLSDWLPSATARPIQQLIFAFCMRVISMAAAGHVVPTRRFLPYLSRKPYSVVSGCLETSDFRSSPQTGSRVKLLYAGKVELEHGISTFLRALELLEASDYYDHIQVDITGSGLAASIVEQRLLKLTKLKVNFHGFVSVEAYSDLLRDADICVALQDPNGRFADLKTPSKLYEFMGAGKAVIATLVGDIGDLPRDTLIVLDSLCHDELAAQLLSLISERHRLTELQNKAQEYASHYFGYDRVGASLMKLIE